MSAESIAAEVRLWAVAQGLMAREQLGPGADVHLAEATFRDLSPVPDQKPAVPQGFAVAYVGFNEVDKEVVVYCNKRVSKKLQRQLPRQGNGDIAISYQVGIHELIGKLPPPPFGLPAAVLHNGRYTCGSSILVGNRIGAGTVGCLVTKNNTLFGLTNSHVAANCGYGSVGLPILYRFQSCMNRRIYCGRAEERRLIFIECRM